MSWHATVVDHLRDLKDQGVPWERAWPTAMAAHPPSARDADYRETLFDMDGGRVPNAYEFFREACRDAWFGERPALRHFSVDALHADEDRSAAMSRRRAA